MLCGCCQDWQDAALRCPVLFSAAPRVPLDTDLGGRGKLFPPWARREQTLTCQALTWSILGGSGRLSRANDPGYDRLCRTGDYVPAISMTAGSTVTENAGFGVGHAATLIEFHRLWNICIIPQAGKLPPPAPNMGTKGTYVVSRERPKLRDSR